MPAEIEPTATAAAVVGCKYPDNGGSKFIWNFSTICLQVYMAWYPRRQWSQCTQWNNSGIYTALV